MEHGGCESRAAAMKPRGDRLNSTVMLHVSGPELQNQRIPCGTAPARSTGNKNEYYISPKKRSSTVTFDTSNSAEEAEKHVDVREIERNAQELDIEKAMKLYFGPTYDTTDRSLVEASETQRFDPSGFKEEDPLKKHMFYTDPYLTCSYCNNLSFINVSVIRRMLSLPTAVADELKLPPEVLPPCPICGKADSFLIGSHDFSAEIAERKKREEEILQRNSAASIVIQTAYRKYLLRMYGSALSDAFLAERYLKHRAAVKINAVARGRLARRIRTTEEHLVTIKKSHPLLIRYALRSTANGPKVFWYKRKVELDMLYENYIDLVSKTGYVPARLIVERNIAEIARRVVVRKNVLIILIQRRWRGVMARRMVMYFRTELNRLFQFNVAQALMIQAVYRGHRARLLIPKIIAEQRREEIMKSYLQRGKDTVLVDKRDKLLEQSHLSYMKERAEEKTARYCSMIPTPSEYGMKKMAAFWDSQFADDILKNDTNALLQTERDIDKAKQDGVEKETIRKEYIMNRIAQRGPPGYGLRSVAMEQSPKSFYVEQDLEVLENIPSIEMKFIKESAGVNIKHSSVKQSLSFDASIEQGEQSNAIVLLPSQELRIDPPPYDILSKAEPSRCRAMRFYFQQELQHLAAAAVERIKKDFKKDHTLRSKFKDFNTQRLRPKLMMHSSSTSAAGDALIATSKKVKTLKDIRVERALRKQQEIVEKQEQQKIVESASQKIKRFTAVNENDAHSVRQQQQQQQQASSAANDEDATSFALVKKGAHFAEEASLIQQQQPGHEAEGNESTIDESIAGALLTNGYGDGAITTVTTIETVTALVDSEASIAANSDEPSSASSSSVVATVDTTTATGAAADEDRSLPNFIVHDDLSNILGSTFHSNQHPDLSPTQSKILIAKEDALDAAVEGEDVFLAAEAAAERMKGKSFKNDDNDDPVVKVPAVKRGDFNYPKHVHFNAMDWLYADHEDI